MSPEERQLVTGLFARTRQARTAPRDSEAEALIADAVREQPTAPYYLAQAVIVQEKALAAADQRIRALEAELAARENETAQSQGGFLNSIFGNGRTAEQPSAPAGSGGPWSRTSGPTPQQTNPQPPQAYGGPWSGTQTQGGGFLRGALGTAAGVAGGVLLANSLSGLFGGHSALSGLGGSALGNTGLPGTDVIEETVVNNYYGDDGRNTSTGTDDSSGDTQQADYDDSGTDGFDDGDSFA